MRLTPILFALLVSLSVPVTVMAVPSGETAATARGTNHLGSTVEWSVTSVELSGGGTDTRAGPATTNAVVGDGDHEGGDGDEDPIAVEPGEQYVVPIDSHPDEPFATGFFTPQVDGILYGYAGERLPDDVVREWEDAYTEEVELRSPTEKSLTGLLYTKQVRDGVYVGLDLSEADVDPDEVVETWVQYDRDGDGALSPGDVRIVAPGPASETELTTIEAFDGDGWTDSPFRDRDLPTDAGLYAAAVGAEGTFEAELDLGTLEEVLDTPRTLDEQPYYEFVGHGVVVRTTEDTYALNGAGAYVNDELVGVSAYNSYLHVPAFELFLPTDDVGVDHVEITQSVQRADNSLPVIRDKETLARVFVTHDNAEDTEVEVRLTGWALGGGVTKLGTLSTTHTAPAGPLDREVESHSANFELPDGWTDAQGLLVRAEVRRPGFIEEDDSDNDGYEFVPLVETFDPAIYYIRLNTGSDTSPVLEPTANVDAATATLADVFPVADPQFVELDTSVVGSVQGLTPEERIEELNTATVGIVLAIGLSGGDPDIPVPAQVYGFTPDYAGISDPAWSSQAASGASIASIGGVDAAAHDRLVMAHEVNHNIGSDGWGRHAGNGSAASRANGCGAGGDAEWQDLYDRTYVHEVGWDPSVGIIPAEYPDYQSYCQIWEVSVPAWTGGNDPAQWVSEYRWLRMTDRFRNWDGNPVHPDLRAGSSSGALASAEATDGDATGGDVPTARIVSGYLYEDGGGELRPSFERPGAVPPRLLPSEAVEDPRAVLVVDYADGTAREIPLTVEFEGRHEEATGTARWPFTVAVPEESGVVGLSLVDPATDEELDSLAAGEWTLTGVEFDLPAVQRGQAAEVGVDVDADTDRTLYKRLLYSPDGELFYPYGPAFTGDSAPVLFEELPGGEAATFLLLVSDGVRTEFAESPAFDLAHAPPEVSIARTERWRTISNPAKDPNLGAVGVTDVGTGVAGEPTDRVTTTVQVVEPVDVGVGQSVSLDASGQDEYGNPLPPSAYAWTIVFGGAEKPILLPGGTGPRFERTFRLPGTYTVVVKVTDPATGLTETDSIEVEVTEPPLPDGETYETFIGTVLEETTDAPAVSVTPSSVDEGGAATVQIDVEDDDDDAHLVWVDWPDGTRTERVVTGGSLTLSRTVGDDATVDVTVLDDGFGVGTATVEVSNVAPDVTLSTPALTSLPGGDAIVTTPGSSVSIDATGLDPGSDDLTFEWKLDGELVETTTVYNDGTGPDPAGSPDGVFPFSATDTASLGFDEPGIHALAVTVTDDDGGSATATLTLLVTGDGDRSRGLGYWRHQMTGAGKVDYGPAELEALLGIVDAASAVFPSDTTTTVDDAADTLRTAGPEFRPKAEAQLLAAWLNLAAGGVTWDERVDVDGDGEPDRTVGDLLTEADGIVADESATDRDLERAKDLAEAINRHGEQAG